MSRTKNFLFCIISFVHCSTTVHSSLDSFSMITRNEFLFFAFENLDLQLKEFGIASSL